MAGLWYLLHAYRLSDEAVVARWVENPWPSCYTARTFSPIALSRKNALFACNDAGADNWGVIASLIETCKMNLVDPHAWLASTLKAFVSGHKQSKIADLLPWNYASKV